MGQECCSRSPVVPFFFFNSKSHWPQTLLSFDEAFSVHVSFHVCITTWPPFTHRYQATGVGWWRAARGCQLAAAAWWTTPAPAAKVWFISVYWCHMRFTEKSVNFFSMNIFLIMHAHVCTRVSHTLRFTDWCTPCSKAYSHRNFGGYSFAYLCWDFK